MKNFFRKLAIQLLFAVLSLTPVFQVDYVEAAATELISTPLYADVTHYWRLSDGNATVGGKNLTQTNGSFSTGKFGNAFYQGAGGSGAYLHYNGDIGNNSGSVSICFWIKLNGSDIGSGAWWIYEYDSASGKMNFNMWYSYNAGTRQLVWDRGAAGIGPHELPYNYTLDSNWHMITMTFDGTNMLGYIDASQVASRNAAGDGSADDGDGFNIGHNGGTASGGFNFDDFHIYINKVLTPTEISNLFNGWPSPLKRPVMFFE